MSEVNMQELMESYNEYILKLEAGCLFIAEELRMNKEDAIQHIYNFSEGMEWLILVSRKFKEQQIEVELDEAKLIAQLQEINEAIQRKDMNLVADLFEYEIAEYFNTPKLIEGIKNVGK